MNGPSYVKTFYSENTGRLAPASLRDYSVPVTPSRPIVVFALCVLSALAPAGCGDANDGATVTPDSGSDTDAWVDTNHGDTASPDIEVDTTVEDADTPDGSETSLPDADTFIPPENCQWFQQCGGCGSCDDGDPCTDDRCLPGLTCGHLPLTCQCQPSCLGLDGRLAFVQALSQGQGGLPGLAGIRDIALSADEQNLYVAAAESGAVTHLQRVEGQWLWASTQPFVGASSLAFVADGSGLLVNGQEQVALVPIDPATGAVGTAQTVANKTEHLATWGTRVVAVEDEELRLYTWEGQGVTEEAIVNHNDLNGAGKAAFSPDGKHLYVTGYNAHAVSVWDVTDTTLAHNQTITGHRGLNTPTDVVVSPGGSHVYVSSMCDHEVAILTRDGTTGQLTWVGSAHSEQPIPEDCGTVFDQDPSDENSAEMTLIYPTAVDVSPDGTQGVASAALGMAAVRYTVDGDTLTVLDAMLDPPPYVDFNASTDGKEGLSTGWVEKYRGSGSVVAGSIESFVASQVTGAVAVMNDEKPAFVQHGLGGVVDLSGAYNLDISPDDKHVYIAPRNHHTIGAFAIDETDGHLTPIATPPIPFEDPWRRSLLRVRVTRPDGLQVLAVSGDQSVLHVLDRDADTGELTPASDHPLPDCGPYPAFPVDVVSSPDGSSVYLADFQFDFDVDGCLMAFQRAADGTLGAVTVHQGSHFNGLESIVFSSDGKDVYTAAHLGAAVTHLKRDPATGDLTQAVPIVEESLFGVEMLTIAPDDRHVYVGNPVMSNITVFERNESTGALTLIQEIGPDTEGLLNNAAGIVASPDGTHVYVAARVDNAINIYGRGEDGTLQYETVVTDRPSLEWINGLAITSDNRFLIGAAVNASAVTTFSIVTGLEDGCGGVCQ